MKAFLSSGIVSLNILRITQPTSPFSVQMSEITKFPEIAWEAVKTKGCKDSRNGLLGRGNRKNVNKKIESGNLDIFTRLDRCSPNLQSNPFYCIPALSSDNYHR